MKYLFLLLAVNVTTPLLADELRFPSGFRWCVSTAAHQVEGGNLNSDWWDWEQLPGKIKNGDRSGDACDEWNRIEEDVALIRELNASEYRFSIEWAKVEPLEGHWDEAALDHYRNEIAVLKKNGIKPLVTLHHFTNPRWFAAKGGWEWKGAPDAFTRYALKVQNALGPDVRDWVTFNEPMVFILAGYGSGGFPPGETRPLSGFVKPILGILKSHAQAYHAMHRLAPEIRLGMANHLRVFDPKNAWNPLDDYIAMKLDEAFNWAIPNALETGVLQFSIPFQMNTKKKIPGLRHSQDYVGVNYYSRNIVGFDLSSPGFFKTETKEDALHSDTGDEIYPEGFYRILKAVTQKFPGKSILITENGVSDHEDRNRPDFIRDHLEALHRAISEGAPVENYCHWSLLDNFEWTQGFTPRYGLYEVDYTTLTRHPRRSAFLFSGIAKNNGF